MLEAAGPEAYAVASAAAASDIEIHAVTTAEAFTAYPDDLRSRLAGHLFADLSRPDQALRDVVDHARHIGIDGVLTTNEFLTPLVARISAALGLPGNDPDLADAARDKVAMAASFHREGVTTPRSRVVHLSDALLPGVDCPPFPCVVKPVDGAGSSGVTVVMNRREAREALRALRGRTGMYGTPSTPLALIQEYVTGVEYSVESMTQAGRNTHLCVTRKTVTGGARRVEVGHGLPASLQDGSADLVHEEVSRAIRAVGIRNGPSHAEVVLSPRGDRCVVLEIGARIGAGHIGVLIHHALGIDPWRACLDLALGRPAALASTRRRYATARFITSPRAGRLRLLAGLPERAPDVPVVRVRRQVGSIVAAPEDNTARIASFAVVGSDEGSVNRRAEEILAAIRVEVDPLPHEPPGPT